MNKKSQMIGQIFIYVLSLLLIGFILIYGYNAIKDIMTRSEEVAFAKFKNDLSNIVEVVAPDTDTVKIRSFEAPAGISKVCFVKNYPDFPTLSNTGYPIIEQSVNENVKKNVFLIREVTERSYFIGDISVEDGILCINVTNNIVKIKIEGKGSHASLSKT